MINFFNRGKPRVLLLNNNRRESGAFAGFLTDGEYEILTAGSGDTGVRAAEKTLPNIIVLDCEASGKACWKTLSALKNNKKTADIPVLMRAARGSQASACKALSGGAQGCLARSDKSEVVAAKIARRLGRASRG